MAHMREPAAIRRDMNRAEEALRLARDRLVAALPDVQSAVQDIRQNLAVYQDCADALGLDRADVIAAAVATAASVASMLSVGDAPKPKATRKRK